MGVTLILWIFNIGGITKFTVCSAHAVRATFVILCRTDLASVHPKTPTLRERGSRLDRMKTANLLKRKLYDYACIAPVLTIVR